MYLKHKTCNTKIFIELKNPRTFKNQGWKKKLFQEQFKNIQGFHGPVALDHTHLNTTPSLDPLMR